MPGRLTEDKIFMCTGSLTFWRTKMEKPSCQLNNNMGGIKSLNPSLCKELVNSLCTFDLFVALHCKSRSNCWSYPTPILWVHIEHCNHLHVRDQIFAVCLSMPCNLLMERVNLPWLIPTSWAADTHNPPHSQSAPIAQRKNTCTPDLYNAQ